jgi:hypothetical protein
LHAFLILALNADEWFASENVRLAPTKRVLYPTERRLGCHRSQFGRVGKYIFKGTDIQIIILEPMNQCVLGGGGVRGGVVG